MSDENREEIYTGQISFELFKSCGLWESTEWTSRWKLIFYRIYSVCIVIIYSTFTCSTCIHLFQENENVEEVTQSVFYSSTFLMTFIQIMIILRKREIFMKTQEMLTSEICRTQDIHEVKIMRNYSLRGRKMSIYYLIVVHITGITMLLSPLASIPDMTLPVPYCIPFSLTSKLMFSLSYLQQIIGVVMAVHINVGMVTLLMSVLLQMCCQLEIVMHRLGSLSKLTKSTDRKSVNYYQEAEITNNCIKRHLYLHAIGQNINKQFGSVIFLQFFSSMILLCVIIYNLSKMSLTNGQSWIMISCAGSYTLQIFIYCYFGQQMTEKSLEIGTAIYFIKWDALNVNTKKSLLIIMMRSARPIKLTASSIVVLSLETFMKIAKTSYSAYNLLSKYY